METQHHRAVCAIVQLPRDDRAERLQRCYDEVYLPVIVAAGFEVSRITHADLMSDALTEQIIAADVCFADVTEDHPMIWLFLGCALAFQKPLCLVVMESAAESAAPALARVPLHLFHNVIRYPQCLLPSDYAALRSSISDSLREFLPQDLPPDIDAFHVEEASQPSPSHSDALAAGPPLNPEPSLSPYEITALALIAQESAPQGMGPGRLAQAMHKFGLVRATSLAINSLRRKQCVVRHEIPGNQHGITTDVAGLSITPIGSAWLQSHPEQVKQALSQNAPSQESPDLISLLSSLRFRA